MDTGLILCIALVLGWQVLSRLREKHSEKVIYVIDDNEDDILLMKMNIEVPDCHVVYTRSLNEMRKIFLQTFLRLKIKPAAIVSDYHLTGPEKGTDIQKLCELNDIPFLVITGDEREIMGLDEKQIIRKSEKKEYFEQLRRWMINSVA